MCLTTTRPMEFFPFHLQPQTFILRNKYSKICLSGDLKILNIPRRLLVSTLYTNEESYTITKKNWMFGWEEEV